MGAGWRISRTIGTPKSTSVRFLRRRLDKAADGRSRTTAAYSALVADRTRSVYQSGDQILAASYTVKGDTFVAEKPRVWIARLGGTQWDLAPNGKRVAVVTPVESATRPNRNTRSCSSRFFDELRRRVPLGK